MLAVLLRPMSRWQVRNGIVIFFFRSAASGRMSATDTMTLTMTPSQERACLARRLSLSVLVESHRPRHDS